VRIIVAALLVGAVTLLPASAANAKACGTVHARGQTWVVGGAGAKCRFMRIWTRRYVRHRRHPHGWRCHFNGGSGGCHKRGNRDRFFVFYPPD